MQARYTRMPYGLYLSAAGANAQSHRLEVLSHNLANVNTTGFKPHMAMLQSRHAEAIEDGSVLGGDGTIDDLGGGLSINAPVTQFAQGAVQQTGNPTDFAINDAESFFAVQRGETQLLTRAGNFTVDSQGTLVTQQGDPVIATGGGRVVVDVNQNFQVADDGAIIQGGTRQTIKLVRPRETGDLSRVGENLFEPLTEVDEVQSSQRQLRSHALESSAVKPTTAMMELIEASRVYEANVRMIQTQDEAMGQLLGRILR